ncbi:MAG TPA: hypothetical protein VJ952_13520 [Opitutales bacterium]|nr:hypothetical protein [Opitutales bacterium]
MSLVFGLVTGAGLLLTLTTLGLPVLEASVVATLGGFTVGAFVYRERTLMDARNKLSESHRLEVSRLEKRIQHYYEHSLACLAYFDAGTLLIEKVSPGLLQLLRTPLELKARGKSIVELLHISPSRMEAIIAESRREAATTTKAHRLIAEDSKGSQLTLEVTLQYFKGAHMVEAAFFASPFSGREDVNEADMARKDLDRFRRGMYRRETRILELKEEVNKILKEAGLEPRYRFDQKTQDTHVPAPKKSDREEVS